MRFHIVLLYNCVFWRGTSFLVHRIYIYIYVYIYIYRYIPLYLILHLNNGELPAAPPIAIWAFPATSPGRSWALRTFPGISLPGLGASSQAQVAPMRSQHGPQVHQGWPENLWKCPKMVESVQNCEKIYISVPSKP